MNWSKVPWVDVGAGLAAFGALVAVSLWLSPQVRFKPSASGGPPKLPEVMVAEGDSAFGAQLGAESASLLGPTPLFLPTAVNASQVELPQTLRREPGSNFPAIGAKLVHRDDGFTIDAPHPFPIPAQPVEVLVFGTPLVPWSYLEARELELEPLPARAVRVEVASHPGGRIVSTQSVDTVGTPVPAGDWKPVELLLAVDPAGAVGEPVVVHGSGNPEWDGVLRSQVVQQLALGVRLWPGFYSVRIGP